MSDFFGNGSNEESNKKELGLMNDDLGVMRSKVRTRCSLLAGS